MISVREEILRVSGATAKLSFRMNSFADTIIYRDPQPSEATLTIKLKYRKDKKQPNSENGQDDQENVGQIVKNAFKDLTGKDASMITTVGSTTEDEICYETVTHDITVPLPQGEPVIGGSNDASKSRVEPEKSREEQHNTQSFDMTNMLRDKAKEIISMGNIISSYENALKSISKRNTDLSYEVEQLEISNLYLERDNLTKQRILENVGKGRFQEIASYSLKKKEEIQRLQRKVKELQVREKDLTSENRVLKEGSSIFHFKKKIDEQGVENQKLRTIIQALRKEKETIEENHGIFH